MTGPAPDEDALVSDLRDVRDVPLDQLDDTADGALDRIAPRDGSTVLLVAAAFNSSI